VPTEKDVHRTRHPGHGRTPGGYRLGVRQLVGGNAALDSEVIRCAHRARLFFPRPHTANLTVSSLRSCGRRPRDEFVRGGRGSVRNRRSTQSSCVGATIFFATWLRLNLPPPRQARWEAAPRGNAPSLATELVSVENRLDVAGIPHASHSHPLCLATELVSVENRLDAVGIPHASLSHPPPSPPSLSRWKTV